MKTWMLFLLGLVAFLPAATVGQASPDAGARVRVHDSTGEIVTGVLEFVSPEELQLRSDRGPRYRIPRSEVERLETSLGDHRRFGRNFAIAVGISSFAVGTVSAVSWSPCTQTGFMACFLHPTSRGEALSMGLIGGALLGVPIGVIAGLAGKHERWEPLAFGGHGGSPAISLQPMVGSGVGLAASIIF